MGVSHSLMGLGVLVAPSKRQQWQQCSAEVFPGRSVAKRKSCESCEPALRGPLSQPQRTGVSPLLQQGSLGTATGFPGDGEKESLMAWAQALLWPSVGSGRASPGRAAHRPLRTSGCTGTAHLGSPTAPVPGCPLLAPLPCDPALTSLLLHLGCGSGSWEGWVVAQRFLSASIHVFHNLHQHPLRTTCGSTEISGRAHERAPVPLFTGLGCSLRKRRPPEPRGASPAVAGWWETCGAAPQPSSTRWHPLHRGGDGTACTEACTEVWQGPCPGQVGTRSGVTTAGELEPCCSLQERGFCKSQVLVKARGWHRALPCQGFTS